MKKLKIKKTSFLLAVTLLSGSLLSGCDVGDDQTIVPPERLEIANPKPLERDYESINKQHKILMAIIDFGVDYNHPQLIKNLHFTLDQNSHPIGLGYDFIGRDSWPSPYIAMTADINQDISEASKNAAHQLTKHLQLAIDKYPDLERMFNPYRRIDQESDSGSFHGTHVAGLMTYDAPELGLLSYRVMPSNQVFKDGILQEDELSQTSVSKNILKALEMASANGVKIINLSLSMEIKNQETPKSSIDYQNFEEVYKIVETFAKTHPDIALVAAAGNSGNWINKKTHRQLPCGVNASNIICVGATDSDGNLASFSNITLTKSPFILAPGVDILSTIPQSICQLQNDSMNTSQSTDLLSNDNDSPWNNEAETAIFLKNVYERCISNKGFMKSTGTSMSSPIIARALAKLRVRFPLLNAAQSIEKLLSMGKKSQEGPLTFIKLQVEKPSWYESEFNIEKLSDPFFIKKKKIIPLATNEYFEFKKF